MRTKHPAISVLAMAGLLLSVASAAPAAAQPEYRDGTTVDFMAAAMSIAATGEAPAPEKLSGGGYAYYVAMSLRDGMGAVISEERAEAGTAPIAVLMGSRDELRDLGSAAELSRPALGTHMVI